MMQNSLKGNQIQRNKSVFAKGEIQQFQIRHFDWTKNRIIIRFNSTQFKNALFHQFLSSDFYNEQ